MFSFQRKLRLAVIKADFLPLRGHMAPFAGGAEGALMFIFLLVAGDAGRFYFQGLARSMAFSALKRFVPSLQGKAGLAVIKTYFFPGDRVVAFLAGSSQFLLMFVIFFVARVAIAWGLPVFRL